MSTLNRKYCTLLQNGRIQENSTTQMTTKFNVPEIVNIIPIHKVRWDHVGVTIVRRLRVGGVPENDDEPTRLTGSFRQHGLHY